MRAASNGPRIEQLSILAVWHALGGGPLRANRGRAFWRDGDGQNVCLYPDTGTWHDFARSVGGGILVLVETTIGCDRRGAVEWLAVNFGIVTGNAYSAEERREYARHIGHARTIAERLIQRRDEAFDIIHEAKQKKLEDYHRITAAAYVAEDIELLARAEDVYVELEALDVEGDALLLEMDAARLEQLLSKRRAA